MKTRDGKLDSSKNAGGALPGTLKASQVGNTVKMVNDAIKRKGLSQKPGRTS